MLKKKCREIEFDNYVNSETPKFEARRKDEEWSPNPFKLAVMLILMCIGMYFLLTGILYGMPVF